MTERESSRKVTIKGLVTKPKEKSEEGGRIDHGAEISIRWREGYLLLRSKLFQDGVAACIARKLT